MDSELESMKRNLKTVKNKIVVIDILNKMCNVGNAVCVGGSVIYYSYYLTGDIKRDAIAFGCAIGGVATFVGVKHLLKAKRSDLVYEKFLYEQDIDNHPYLY